MSKRVIVTECGSNCPNVFIDDCGHNMKTEYGCRITDCVCSEENCPLTCLPEYTVGELNPIPDKYDDAYTDGWNACIDAITGRNKQ